MDKITIPVPFDAPFVESQTLECEEVLQEIQNTTDAKKIFKIMWQFPLQKVRQACLEVLQSPQAFEPIYPPEEDIAERVVRGLMASRDEQDQKTAMSLLVWRLGYARTNYERPLESALELLRDFQPKDKRSVQMHGIIYGHIKRNPKQYWASSVPEYLEASLKSGNWTLEERSLELICRAEDTSFLPQVMELSRIAQKEKEEKEVFATKDTERFAAAKARGVLEEAVRHLLICHTEQKSDIGDFCVELAQALRKHTGLKDVPRIELDYFPEGPHFPTILPQFYLQVYLRGRTMEEPLRDFLKKCHVNIGAQGCEISNTEHGLELSSGECRLSIKQTRKTARLTISVFVEGEDGGTHCIAGPLTRYIHRAE